MSCATLSIEHFLHTFLHAQGCSMKLKIATLFLLIHGLAVGADERWSTAIVAGVQIANTSNDTGSTAGVVCNVAKDSCLAYVRLPTVDCQDKDEYPMMLNSSVGAAPLTATCTTWGDSKYYVFDNFSITVQAFESGGEVGFAMPMAGGQFRVIRFKTIGATAAIKEARQPPAPKPSSRKSELNL
jgi:hypothetical protein